MQATTANPGTTGGMREDLRDDITLLEPTETPYTSSVTKTSEMKAMLVETLSDRMRAPRTTGFPEGTAGGQGNNQSNRRGRFGVYPHKAKDDWGVTREMRIIAGRGGMAGISDLPSHERTRTIAQVKRDMEAVNLSANETQATSGGSADMKTRGVLLWLSPTGTTLSPDVAADFRIPAACVITHGNTAPQLFTEQSFDNWLKELFEIEARPKNFRVFAGTNVCQTITWFSRYQGNSVSNAYQVTTMLTEHTISLKVDVYESQFGRVDVIPDVFVNYSDSTNSGDRNAAAGLDMDLWYLDQLEELNEAETYNNAGGEGGTIQASWANVCRSPRGNGKIVRV